MHRLDLVSHPRLDRGKKHGQRAMAASLLFHGCALGSIVALALVYHAETPSGSMAGASSIALEKIVIISEPESPPAPQPPLPIPPLPDPPTVTTFSRDAKLSIKPPGVPVLPVAQSESHPKPIRTSIATSHPAHATTQSHPSSAAAAASYAPGPSLMPHPPYPDEARNLHQTGTVVMNVLFDHQGEVVQADVAQTSGFAILDTTTRSYIRQHWHSMAHAGQTVSVPVQFKLENM